MKRLLFILITSLFLFGCKEVVDTKMKCIRHVEVNGVTLYVYDIEGHEYVGYVKTNGEFSTKPSFNCFLSHSGTCQNPIHFPKRGTILVHKDGTTYLLPDTLIEKKNFEIENGVVKVK
jgi:hypothetical protein